MPFTQIHIRKGRTREQKQAIMDGLRLLTNLWLWPEVFDSVGVC